MKKLKQILNEAKESYRIIHDTYTSAVQEAEKYANRKGFVLDDNEMFDTVGTGPRKPAAGNTNRFSVKLYKGKKNLEAGKPERKWLHFQVYGIGGKYISADAYELNAYIG